jgi:hypothetical protein
VSGTRHHFIPQFLLRGFATTRGSDAAYAWVFPRDRKPYNTNVLNIAVEGHFYTYEGTSEVDDLITRAEGPLGEVVDLLRSTGSAESVSKEELASLFTHFEVRTKHLRQNFEALGAFLIGKTIDLVADEGRLTDFLLRRFANDPSTLLDELTRNLRARGVSDLQATQLAAAALPHVPKLLPDLLPKAAAEVAVALRTLLHNNSSALKATVRNAQLNALRAGVVPEAKVELYAGMEFTVIDVSAAGLPLGDSAVCAYVRGAREFKSFLSKDDELVAAYLPLTSSLALCAHKPLFDPRSIDLPRAIVRCSFQSFIAAEPTPRLQDLAAEIGEDAILMSEAELEAVLESAFEELPSKSANPRRDST